MDSSLTAGSTMWKVEDYGITSHELSLIESTVYRIIEYPTRPMLFPHDLLKNHTFKRAVIIRPPQVVMDNNSHYPGSQPCTEPQRSAIIQRSHQ